MKEKTLIPFGIVALHTEPGVATIYRGDESGDLNLDDLGAIAEWLAVAWENVAGEKYQPVVVSERGYVAQESRIAFKQSGDGDGVILPGQRYPAVKYGVAEEFVENVKLERDCE